MCIVLRLAIDNRVNDYHAVPRMFPEGRGILDLIAMHAVVTQRNQRLTVTPLPNFTDSVR